MTRRVGSSMESLRGLALAREARVKMEKVDCCRRDPLVFMERKTASVRKPVPDALQTVEMAVVRGLSVFQAIAKAGDDGWVEIEPGVWMIPSHRMAEIQAAFKVLQAADKEKRREHKAKYKTKYNAKTNKDGGICEGIPDRPERDRGGEAGGVSGE